MVEAKYSGLHNHGNSGSAQSPMGTPVWAVNFLYSRFRGYCFFTLLTLVGLFHFLYGLMLWPIKLVSPTLFRHSCSFVFSYSVPGFLCIPFSWCRTKLIVNNMNVLASRKKSNALFLANHNARIDWMFGLYMGSLFDQRVSFVTEAFIMILPIVGWFRYIAEDMFVFRSFKQDKDRMEKNIQSFHDSKCTRWVFLCPEGAIVDFSAADKQYVKDCNKFCQSMGLEPFEMVLTPRYKGLQCFNKIVTDGRDAPATDISATMTYTQRGQKLSKPLKHDERIIPDLWVILQGGLECHVNIRLLTLSNDPEVMKHQVMRDYAYKDKLLKHFWENGEYPQEADAGSPENPSSPYVQVNAPWVMQNISLFSQFAFWCGVLAYFGKLHWTYNIFVTFYITIAVSHITGEVLASGQSRESIPFEGLTKAILFRMIGREGAKADKKVQNQSDKTRQLERDVESANFEPECTTPNVY